MHSCRKHLTNLPSRIWRAVCAILLGSCVPSSKSKYQVHALVATSLILEAVGTRCYFETGVGLMERILRATFWPKSISDFVRCVLT